MGKITGFLDYDYHDQNYEAPQTRIKHSHEFAIPLSEKELTIQAARCMDCGIPYCHTACPVNNQIPDWNDLVYRDDWKTALENLLSTNNFPEFTGRICPAPCEAGCTLNLIDKPVTIKSIECALIDKGQEMGWDKPQIAEEKTGKSVAIVGSGPAGMAAAQQLARVGHDVHIYEKYAKAGGLLRYGIPDFKMEKEIIDRRVEQMEIEGVTFHYNVHIGVDMDVRKLQAQYDALILCTGAEQPRELPMPGRELDGVHFAMDFLVQQNRRIGQEKDDSPPILATGKNVIVIGGGDTGSDCIGTSWRQGAASVTQLAITPLPPKKENKGLTWPEWPLKFRISHSQEEGETGREFSIMTTGFTGKNGHIQALQCIKVDDDRQEIPGTEFELPADLALISIGFAGPVQEDVIAPLGLKTDARSNVAANVLNYRTSEENVFACGDMRSGQSLVVWAIREGRQCAREVDLTLMGKTDLPR